LARYAIGDVQGCYQPLRALLQQVRFTADRDQLYFVGDLVNRGPQSLEVLRFVRALGANAHTVLGNHDLHLLAQYFEPERRPRDGDTFGAILSARDRDTLVSWLLEQALLLHETGNGDVFVHAGLVPEWTIEEAAAHAAAAMAALRINPRDFLAAMYGNKPVRWIEARSDTDRHRFTINVLTRLRYCTADGSINLALKDSPAKVAAPWKPWFDHASRRGHQCRVVFGHWSTLGFLRRAGIVALDTGCVWGGALTALPLDDPEAPPQQIACAACQQTPTD
jgi:bis(5'-nucleosyl)-tetraphosphatase (symmetrical)